MISTRQHDGDADDKRWEREFGKPLSENERAEILARWKESRTLAEQQQAKRRGRKRKASGPPLPGVF